VAAANPSTACAEGGVKLDGAGAWECIRLPNNSTRPARVARRPSCGTHAVADRQPEAQVRLTKTNAGRGAPEPATKNALL
jgi:hypothetical protein